MMFRSVIFNRAAGATVSALLIIAASGYTVSAQMPASDAAVGPHAAPAALSEARNAVDTAWKSAPLAFSVATFTKGKANGFGQYEPRGSSTFAIGESLNVYVEPIGYGYGINGKTYEISFSADFELHNNGGQILAGKDGFAMLALASRSPNKEYQASLSFRFDDLQPGDYVLRTRLNDNNSNKFGSFSLPFTVKPEPAAQ